MTLTKAVKLIQAESESWFDFCAIRGHVPDNVAHMPSVQLDFLDWMRSGD